MRSLVLLATLVMSAVACSRGDIVTGVSDSTFVSTMVGLRRLAPVTVLDTLARARQRDSVLRAHGITAAQLEAAASKLAEDPVRAAALWQAIEAGSLIPR